MVKVKDQGPRTKDQGSRIKDQGPCPAMNENPRRAVDVILRQSKAPIEILNYIVAPPE